MSTYPFDIDMLPAPRANRFRDAFEQFNDRADSGGPGTAAGVIAAVESATTVTVTDAVIDAFAAGVSGETIHDFDGDEAAAGLRAALLELGLEVLP